MAVKVGSARKDENRKYINSKALIKAIQKLVGVNVITGQCDKDTIKKLQIFLNAKGFNCGTVDGYMGEKTVKAWQKYLNSRV